MFAFGTIAITFGPISINLNLKRYRTGGVLVHKGLLGRRRQSKRKEKEAKFLNETKKFHIQKLNYA